MLTVLALQPAIFDDPSRLITQSCLSLANFGLFW